ncbi:AMP-binding protein [Arcanobacterium hippocoleae]|uniref:AMP-binding protein n=1 Tax=Arcanobacterium hippocoleae TaxID=149017 RepID=UPI00334059B0
MTTSFHTPSCTVIQASRSVAGRMKTAAQIARAFHTWESGAKTKPVFLIPPEADALKSAAEVAAYDIPKGTGVLLRTSGSTSGQGKIVALSWESLAAAAAATHDHFGGPGAWINVLPIYHIAGFQTIFRSIFAGFSPIIGDFTSCADFRQATSQSAAPRHYLSQVPVQLTRLLASAPMDSLLPSGKAEIQNEHPSLSTYCGIDVNLVGGSAIRTDLLQQAQLLGLRTVTSYGMTETCGGCVYDGIPIGDTKLEVGVNGQISIGSSVVALGYLGQPQAQEFSRDSQGIRWHHTRDWGEISDGILKVNGRIDDAIITGGLTVIPQLLEDAISTEFQTQCVVVSVPSKIWGAEVIAVSARKLSQAQVHKFVENKFERGWAPRKIYALTDLPDPRNGSPYRTSHSAQSAPTEGTAQHTADSHGENLVHAPQSEPAFPLTGSGKIDRRKLAALVAQIHSD